MARYEVVLRTKGMERVVKSGIRRENGAIAERNIAADSEYHNKRKRIAGDPFARVVRGSVADDPNGEAIIYFDDVSTIVTIVTYRRNPPVPEPDTLADDLLASLLALNAGSL